MKVHTRTIIGASTVVLAACGGGSRSTPTSTGPAAASVSIVEYSFSPSSVTIKVGSTVQWTNDGQLAHNVTADDGSWSSGNLSGPSGSGGYGGTSGGTFGHIFNQAGTYTYHCSLHPPASFPGFVGTVVVTP
jgi:plastocyanin